MKFGRTGKLEAGLKARPSASSQAGCVPKPGGLRPAGGASTVQRRSRAATAEAGPRHEAG